MATVYSIEITTVSDYINFKPEYIEKIVKKAIEEIEDEDTGVKLDNVEIKAERIA